jgi:hypothetical protein
LSIIRILRLLRLFRIFKVNKYSRSLRVISRTAAGIVEHLLLMVFSTLLGIIVISSLVFYAEQSGAKFDNENDVWIRDLDGSERFLSFRCFAHISVLLSLLLPQCGILWRP